MRRIETDEQLLLLKELKTNLLGRLKLGSSLSLKDKPTKIQEQIVEMKGAAQRVKVRQEEIDGFLVPQIQKQTVHRGTDRGCVRAVRHAEDRSCSHAEHRESDG